MSFEQYSKLMTIRVLEDDDKADMGLFAMSETVELSHMVLTMHKRGNHAGGEQFRINIYSNVDTFRKSVLYQSNVFNWSDANSGEHFVGTIRFDFAGEFLRSGESYRLELEAIGYTRDEDNFYFSYLLDHPAILNQRAIADEAGAQVAILGRII